MPSSGNTQVEIVNQNGTSVGVTDNGELKVGKDAVTPSTLLINGTSGTTNAAWKSFTFVVVAGTITIGGVTFGQGTYTFDNSPGTINAIAYDGTGSSDAQLLIMQ